MRPPLRQPFTTGAYGATFPDEWDGSAPISVADRNPPQMRSRPARPRAPLRTTRDRSVGQACHDQDDHGARCCSPISPSHPHQSPPRPGLPAPHPPAVGLVMRAGGGAKAHGTPVKPAGRTFLCRQDGLTDTGGTKPVNPVCEAAAQGSGTTPTTTARWVRGERAQPSATPSPAPAATARRPCPAGSAEPDARRSGFGPPRPEPASRGGQLRSSTSASADSPVRTSR